MTALFTLWVLGISHIDPAWIALLGTIFGGAGLKAVEAWLSRNKDAIEVRRDLRVEITELVARIDTLEDEITEWRTKFYEQQEAVARLRRQVISLGAEPTDNAISPPEQK